jgi:hypothetical protein
MEIRKELKEKLIKKYLKNDNSEIKLKIPNLLGKLISLQSYPSRLNNFSIGIENLVICKNGHYAFTGTKKGGNRLLISNYPCFKKGQEFTLQMNGNQLNFSHQFYFEIIISNGYFRPSWQNMCISIGFGENCSRFDTQVGWMPNSIGLHSDDGGIYMGKTHPDIIFVGFNKGDVIGAGVIKKNNQISFFFTKNGKILTKIEDFLYNDNHDLYVQIGLDHCSPIFFNFGFKPFLFNI